MMLKNQLIFDESDSVRSRTEELLSHVKTEKFKSNINQWLKNLGYICLNSFLKN
jgi:hypothetical protein